MTRILGKDKMGIKINRLIQFIVATAGQNDEPFLRHLDKSVQSAFFEHLIDALVYELYFPNEIKSAGKEILPHLGKLEPLTDGMSEEEKLAVIQHQFNRLYDPRHPVCNHLDTPGHVEVVRTIRGALQ